jgi:glycosyltransferase involved in cell wall biosynthesis
MQIAYHTHEGGMDLTQGYGYAGYGIVTSLQKLGHTTPFNYAGAPVLFDFTQPGFYQYHEGQYHIGYTPWESTKLHDNWENLMNMCDEVWTTSDWCANVFKECGVTKPIYVYEHGIDHAWTPWRRKKGRVLRFLHHGEPAVRKNGWKAFEAFAELFGNDPRYELTLKSNGYTTIRAHRIDGSIAQVNEVYKNVRVIKEVLDINDLISLYKTHDVLIYPSFGEGFGFIPLQAMATGMPVIMNTSWAPYARFSVGLDVKDRYIESPWQNVHPGEMLEPDFDSLKEQMRRAADDFETFSDHAFELAPQIHEEYDWVNVTERAFAHVVKKFV